MSSVFCYLIIDLPKFPRFPYFSKGFPIPAPVCFARTLIPDWAQISIASVFPSPSKCNSG